LPFAAVAVEGIEQLVGIGPKDEIEGMIAAQLLAARNAAMECYRGPCSPIKLSRAGARESEPSQQTLPPDQENQAQWLRCNRGNRLIILQFADLTDIGCGRPPVCTCRARGRRSGSLPLGRARKRRAGRIDVDGRICSARVTEVLSPLLNPARRRSCAARTGREFVSKALLSWIVTQGIDTALIEPGKPRQTGVQKASTASFATSV
jgi:hypothetical protein